MFHIKGCKLVGHFSKLILFNIREYNVAKTFKITTVILSFVGSQVIANPFGPNLPPVVPLPLPTSPSTEPGINIPGLPSNPLNPGTPIGRGGNPNWPISPGLGSMPGSYPSWPVTPFPTYPGSGAIGINYTCPLVDQETNVDLLTALDVLQRAIQTPLECRNDANLGNAVKTQELMRNAALEIRRLWNDPDHLSENLVNFDVQLQTLVTGVSLLSDTLSNNSLLNSNCGKEMMTSGKALLAMSDLITGVAPYALFAASAASSLAVAVPYVVGVVGLSGMVKLVAQLSNNKTPLNMDIYEHRQTLLKITCEYDRVATKIRYLKLAQSGKIDMLTREISNLNNVLFYDQQAFGNSLDEILNNRKEFYKKIDEVRVQMYIDIRSHNELRKYLARASDDSMSCSLGKQILNNIQTGKFPISIKNNFKNLLDISVPHDELGLNATYGQFDFAIDQLRSNVENSNGYQSIYCGQATHRFVNTLERILQTIEEELIAQEELYENKLSENPTYRNWYAKTSNIDKDRETLKRVVTTMQKVSQDSSVMSQSELDQRMESLRAALFGTSGFSVPFFNTVSPVESWLQHTSDVHSRSISKFNKSLSSLMDEVGEMRINQHKKITYHVDETVSILPKTILNEWFLLDVNETNFTFIAPSRFPVGSKQQEVICQRLEEVWLSWDASMRHLTAMKHLCDNIASFIDSSTSKEIVNICGRRHIDGTDVTDSLIAKTESKLLTKGFKSLALKTSSKLSELKCVGH